MWINFYKVTNQAREDYSELCQASVQKIASATKTDDEFLIELNRKIRKLANLGHVIDSKNGFEVRQYFDLLFVVKDYVIEYVYKMEGLEPCVISEEEKSKYDYVEKKLTDKNKEC